MHGHRSVTSLRVCIAEDDGDSREVLRQMLVALGHHVVCNVDNGQELLNQASSQDVDVVIVDLEMPLVDGLEAAEEIWNGKRTPVILVTGHSDVSNIVLENEPVVMYLTKPVGLERLQAALEAAVGNSAATGSSGRRRF